ncbi:ATP-binding protein [Colwelliaceae bacterium 6441]
MIAACAHFLLVKFGSLFTLPFGYVSLIWPVSGVMLGLYFLYGRPIIVGTLVSSLFIFYQQSLLSPIPSYIIIALSAIGVLQLILSKQLVNRFLVIPIRTHKPSEIIKFLLLTGPIASLITSSIFALTLSTWLNLHADVWVYLWMAKWIGDFISIIFITPIILFLGETRYIPRAKRPFAAITTSLLVLTIIFSFYYLSNQNNYAEKEQYFLESIQPFTKEMNTVQTTIKHHLIALDGLFQASESVTRTEFKAFTDTIFQPNFKIRALAFLPLIYDQDRKIFEQKLSSEGLGEHIKSLTDSGFQPAKTQPYYIPILFSEPLALNKSAIGLDVSTHPPVKNSINKAIKEKKHVITPLLSLVQQQNKYTGVIVYYPTFKDNALIGLVEAVFELDSLLLNINNSTNNNRFTYQMSYGDDNVITSDSHRSDSMFHHTVGINIFDKKGLLSFSSTDEFELILIDWGSLFVIIFGCIIGIICVMFIFLIISFNHSLKRKVKESTAELMKTNEELLYANTAKNLFLANISHEYRTPLNAIIGFTEIAQREIKDDNAQNYLTKINHSSTILLNIVNDVLDISKMQAGELNLENRSFNPSIETLSVIEMLNEKAAEKSIKINTIFAENFNLWVAGDDFRFKQILINLLNNAIKFTQKGMINIEGDCQDTDHNTRIITVVVKDTGIGISEEHQKHIFNAFAQAEGSTTRKYGGTGLGLSIVKQLSELMNGNVTLKSKQKEGSEFTVTLELPQSSKPCKNELAFDNLTQTMQFKGINILVVEDNKINQIIVQKQLKPLGVTCDLVNDGEQALAYLEMHKPKLILMDLQMPNMDGFTASSIIKQNEHLKDIPIVILSASVGKADKERAAELGIEDFINKPFQQADLHHVLNKYLSAEK